MSDEWIEQPRMVSPGESDEPYLVPTAKWRAVRRTLKRAGAAIGQA